MTDEEIEKLIKTNERLLLILGVASVFIRKCEEMLNDREKEHYKWLVQAIENVVYLDKPLPEMP